MPTAGPVLSLGIDASAAQRGASEFSDVINKVQNAGRRATDSIDDLDKNIKRLPGSFVAAQSAMAGFIGGVVGGVSQELTAFFMQLPGQIIATADAFQRLEIRLGTATGSIEAGHAAFADLYAMSQRLGVGIEATGGFFVRLSSQSKELGLSYEQMLTVTETLEGAFKLSGASAGETSAAMTQLGQAFASGKFQGDEFRSVAENAPIVLDKLSQALGVTRGQLMEMARNGELTTQTMSEGLLKIAPQVANEVQQMGSTVAEQAQRMENAWGALMSEFGKTGGVSESVQTALRGITSVLESEGLQNALKGAAFLFSSFYKVIGDGLTVMQAYSNELAKISGQTESGQESIGATLGKFGTARSLMLQQREGIAQQMIRKGTGFDAAPGGISLEDFNIKERDTFNKIPAPKARPRAPSYGMQEFEKPKGGGRKPGTGEDIFRRSQEQALKDQGDLVGAINFRRDEELKALAKTSLSAKEKAIARVNIEKAASHDIMEVRQKEASAIGKLEEEVLKQQVTAESTSGEERLAIRKKIIEMERDARIAELDTQPMSSEQRKRSTELISESAQQKMADVSAEELAKTKSVLDRIQDAYDAAFGNRVRIIERQRDEEIKALNETSASAEEKARARVQIEETSSQEIIQIRQQEAAEIQSLERENLQQRASTSFGSERKQYQIQLVQMERDSRIAEIEASAKSEEQKQRASALISDTAQQRIADIDPTPIAAAQKALLQFGEQMTSVEGMTQGMIQGIASIGATATSAFADAIVSGEDFGDMLESLGKTIEKMIIQLTLQMALQAALGQGASLLGGMLGPGAGAGAGTGGEAGASPYPMFSPLAKGGAVRSQLEHGVYTHPTYFPLEAPVRKSFAKGTGLLGEAGPEAVLPLKRSQSGGLGVETTGSSKPSTVVNIQVNNTSKANVRTEEKQNESGGRDIILTIADEVEGIVANRMSRSGTRVNRATQTVGSLRAT